MNPTLVDRDTFLELLRASKLLTKQHYGIVTEKLADVPNAREIAKALVSWKLLTKFQAKQLLRGKSSGFFLGPYRILDELGHGGMGRVYKAMHQTMNRLVALKILAPQLMHTPRAKELFLREVQAAAQLNHPNIVMAFDANELAGRHYLAMEFVDGPNLEAYVKKHGPLPIGMACEIVFQAANGLQHAHERGMVHRDIKPANLLVQQEPGSDVFQIKILDFGLARLHAPQEDGGKTIVAAENTVMGTPDFLSPEQSRDLHRTDIRSDLYGLGCTLYYLLSGQVPFPGGSTLDKVMRHNNEPATPIEELRADVPPQLAQIVRRLMAKKPEDRYPTPDDLMDVLAPHAAPSVMDWPITPPAAKAPSSASQERPVLLEEEFQADTEPHAHHSTQISDEDSILDWVDTHSARRRRIRYILIAAAILTCGLFALTAVALTAWLLLGQW